MSNPDTSFNKSSHEDIDKEVRNLIRKNVGKHKSNYSILDDLREKYGKDKNIINAIVDKYNKSMNRIKKLSFKIRERLLGKYPNLPMKEYINKINEYKSKYDFNDSEAQAIINDIFMNKNKEHYDPNDAYSMSNEMTKALGFIPASYNLSGQLNIEKDQMDALQQIIQHDELFGDLHNQVVLQSITYDGVNSLRSADVIDRQRVNVYSFVHPVVAALFFHKFHLIDEHMLMASISKIIHQKYNGVELQTQPEYELYWDIATDPAETACVSKSKPFDDLLKRCIVQIKLMESVLNLRQGKFYMNDLSSFILAIDNCRASVFDAADLAYVKDEGTILRKLLAAFSLRPTIVLTRPVYSISTAYSNIPALAAGHITSLPMITIRLPNTSLSFVDNTGATASPSSIAGALESQPQLYIHHRQIVQKKQEIIHSRQILLFYIHRRTYDINTARFAQPYAMASLPVTMAQYEKLNKHGISVDDTIKVNSQDFHLRSIVAVQTKNENDANDTTIICCKTYIISKNDSTNTDTSFEYKPLDLKTDKNVEPITVTSGITVSSGTETGKEAIKIIAQTKGTIFVYSTNESIQPPKS